MSKEKFDFSFIKNFFENDFIKDLMFPIHKTGYPFIIIFFVSSLILGSFSDFLGWIGIILTIWCIFFFRDPNRITPKEKNLIISPADGKIIKVEDTEIPPEFKEKKTMKKISIFMNVFNVHVNRVPAFGKIKNLQYSPGAFFNASFDKSSKENERMSIKLKTMDNKDIYFVQIAGLIARRIKCDLNLDQEVKCGEKFGIIRFGSRMDVYFSNDIHVNVLEGQTVIGGETVLADFSRKKKSPVVDKNK